MKKSPLATVKDRFETKAKLVEALKALAGDELWMARTSADRGGKKTLEHVSNAKLLKLHATFSAVKKEFGSRAKLVAAVLEAEGRTKDAGYQTRLEKFPVPRLYDQYKSAKKRAKAATKA